MFVDPRQPGKVNYEKFLSFISSSLKASEKPLSNLPQIDNRYILQIDNVPCSQC